MTLLQQIPKSVEQAIIKVRGITNKHETKLRFWEIPDDDALEDFLFGDFLNVMLLNFPEDELASLPQGYIPLINVLEFERHCQFEGWTAVSNHGEAGMRLIIRSYEFLGLGEEAKALTAVTEAYVKLSSHDGEEFHNALGKAYRSISNPNPDIEDRIPLILKFVRENPKFFVAQNDSKPNKKK